MIKAVQEKETTCPKCERHRQTFPRHFDPLSTRQLKFLTNSFVLLILDQYSLCFNHYFTFSLSGFCDYSPIASADFVHKPRVSRGPGLRIAGFPVSPPQSPRWLDLQPRAEPLGQGQKKLRDHLAPEEIELCGGARRCA